MTNETQQSPTEQKNPSYGMRLKSAREALGLERKDVAAQLRLNEKIILMMEKDRYAPDLPVTFIRGYIRAYSKLLQIPESELKKALEPIKPKAAPVDTVSFTKTSAPITSTNYFMQFFTLLILCTLGGLVGMWWYNQPTTTVIAENQPIEQTIVPEAPIAPTAAITEQAEATPIQNSTPLPLAATAEDNAANRIIIPFAPKNAVTNTPASLTHPNRIARAKPSRSPVEVVDLSENENSEEINSEYAD